MSLPDAPILTTIKRLPRPVWVLLAGTFVNRFGAFVLVFLVLYLTDKGYSGPQAGLALSLYGLGQMTAAAVGGYLADHLGRRITIVLSMYLAAVALVLLYHADSLGAILVMTFLSGATAELYRPASAALLTDLSRVEERVTVFATYRVAINLGFMLGPAVGGLLAERSFAWLFYGDAVTCVAFGTLAAIALPRVPGSKDHIGWLESLKVVAQDRSFLRFLVAATMIGIIFFQPASGWALQIKAWDYSSATYGVLLSLNGLLVLLFELPLTMVTRRYPARQAIAVGYAMIGIGFGLTLVAANLPLLALTVVIWTLGEIVNAPVAISYVSNLAPAHLRGRYQGAFSLTWGSALVLGPIIGTSLFDISPAALWTFCLALGLTAATLVLAE